MAIIHCYLSIDDFNHVAIACQNVSHQWEKLAKYLDIDRPTVEGIQKERGEQTITWCLNKLLTAWLCQPSPTQPKPSWRILCDAVSNIDRPLSEKIWTDHTSGCSLCRGVRFRPIATAVRQVDVATAAKNLSDLFDDLLDFLTTEIRRIVVSKLRLCINKFFRREEELNDETGRHLLKIEDCPTSDAVLNYFIRHNFIGYINYSLIKVFQGVAKSPLLDKRIEEYEKDYQCFLELSLSQIHDGFQQCPDLRPDYPAGIPKFTIHLQSEWNGKSMFNLKEFLKLCFYNSDCIDQLMIAKISRGGVGGGGGGGIIKNVSKEQISDTQDLDTDHSASLKASQELPQDKDLLDILSSIPVTTQLQTFCINLGLPSARCSEIFDDPTIRGDFTSQRHRVLRLWGEVKERTWKDFVKALDTTGYEQKTKELAERYKIQL